MLCIVLCKELIYIYIYLFFVAKFRFITGDLGEGIIFPSGLNYPNCSVWYGSVYRYVRVLRLLTHIPDQFIVRSISKGANRLRGLVSTLITPTNPS